MVQVRETEPLLADGTLDQERWLQRVSVNRPLTELQLLHKACQLASEIGSKHLTPLGATCLHQGLMMAEILDDLGLDTPSLAAAIIYESSRYGGLTETRIGQELGDEVQKLIQGVNRMQAIQVKSPVANAVGNTEIITDLQLHNLRSMLLAVVEDIRVVLIRLAEHTSEMRSAIEASETIRKKLAIETREIYAPLTNRLGIGQLKWELEDLAFRCLDPIAYKHIAKLLDERRVDREDYIERTVKEIEDALKAQDINATVYGRAKNIFSIWKKMQRKRVSYSEIYDVRAIRILVPELKDCYAALGIVHTLWKHIPKEFDDYITTPKENGYRSLHTAVVGPEGKTLEIQIRTTAMHEESELGVAAHWRYKEGIPQNFKYQKKLAHLRQLLNWQQESPDADDASVLHAEVFEDRVYVFTPKGQVIDLVRGATPLDFAYQVHTEIGHRCRGAKVDGRIVPLTYTLRSGQQVEILTTNVSMPSRDWLNPQLGYLKTARARAKVHLWFKRQDREKNIVEGRSILERELKRLGIEQYSREAIAAKLRFSSVDDLLAAIGAGDVRWMQILGAVQSMEPPLKEEIVHKPFVPRVQSPTKGEIMIDGTGNYLYYLAHCCQPVPGEEIIGYIKLGRGVAVHRADCKNILQLKESQRSRLIQVAWGRDVKNKYLADIAVKAYDRQGLIRDITNVLTSEYINVAAFNASYNKEDMAEFKITVQISGIEALSKVLSRIQQLPNIVEAYRYKQ